MWEVPKYIRQGIHLSTVEIELLIESICNDQPSIKYVDRFIHSRLTEYEIAYRNNTINDFEKSDWSDWRDVEQYFESHRFSFERQYFKRRLWG